MVIETSKY